ncbi:MAG: UDP-N-acetylglucosamine--N-acetylmuramyl-(pentapeptide) pyrophosphoryl-undecaprenol N-acetylglucosamine transferase [Phycisphaeraceae bacterium]
MQQDEPTIFFAGGGTGGHLFPNLAMLERLRQKRPSVRARLLVSERAIDARILANVGEPFTAIAAQPLILRPGGLVRFARGYRAAKRQVARLIRREKPAAMVATGGFVSGPAMAAAAKAGLPRALVNLDAVPGKANRLAVRHASAVFSAYETPVLPRATHIGLPLRRSVVPEIDAGEAKTQLGFDPERPLLLVTAGSQGGRSINRAMAALAHRPAVRQRMRQWQVLHLSGEADRAEIEAAYREAEVVAKVLAFCDRMGLAWAAADLAVSRAGAGAVAEAWATRVPAIFLPYPFHKDEHQRYNAEPLVRRGGAMLLIDRIEPDVNADAMTVPLADLLENEPRREAMRTAMLHQPPDGAEVVANWLAERV